MSKKKLLNGGIGVLILFIAFMVSGALVKSKPQPKKDDSKHDRMFVKAEKVHFSDIKSGLTYRGRVTAFDNISLSAEVQGKLLQGDVLFKAGESFNKGDVLVKIYDEDIYASLKAGKSSFLQTLSIILPDLKVDYPDKYDKWSSFFNSIDVEKPLPQLPAIQSNQEKVYLAANNVLASYYNLQQQEINLSRYIIIAPFTGSFKAVNREIGAIASPGVELATIIRTDKLEVIVPVFPSDLKWINKGDKFHITNEDGVTKVAIISRIADFVDEATQSVNVYLTYESKTRTGFLEGEYVNVFFKNLSITGFEIPREALIDGSFVYELRKHKLEKVEVEILRQLDDSYIITGVDKGKLVVTESLASVNSDVEYFAR